MKLRRKSATRLLLWMSSSVCAFSPNARYAHSTVYSASDNKVFFIGGVNNVPSSPTDGIQLSSDFFSLDLSQSFNTSEPPYTLIGKGPVVGWAAASLGLGDKSVWVIGGVTPDCASTALVHRFDMSTQTWQEPTIKTSIQPSRRSEYQAIRAGKDSSVLYIFGGSTDPYTCSLNTSWSTAMDVLHTGEGETVMSNGTGILSASSVDPQWMSIPTNNIQSGINDHAGVVIGDSILYIGGRRGNWSLQDMSEVLRFNTTTGQWSTINVIGDVPSVRAGHTAVTTDDGRVIVYGGFSQGSIVAKPDLIVLDTTQSPWKWTSPNISNAITSRSWHSAIYKDKSMIVAFGLSPDGIPLSDMQVLDINSFSWSSIYPIEANHHNQNLSNTQPVVTKDATTTTTTSQFTTTTTTITQVNITLSTTAATVVGYPHPPPSPFPTPLSSASPSAYNTGRPQTSSSQTNVVSITSSPSPSSIESGSSPKKTVGVVAALSSILGAAALAVVGGLYYFRRRTNSETNSSLSSMKNPPPVSTLSLRRPRWETINSQGTRISEIPFSSGKYASSEKDHLADLNAYLASESLYPQRRSTTEINQAGATRGRFVSIDMENANVSESPVMQEGIGSPTFTSTLRLVHGFSWAGGQDVMNSVRTRTFSAHPYESSKEVSGLSTFEEDLTFSKVIRSKTLSETSSGSEYEREMRERMISISTIGTAPRMNLRVINDV